MTHRLYLPETHYVVAPSGCRRIHRNPAARCRRSVRISHRGRREMRARLDLSDRGYREGILVHAAAAYEGCESEQPDAKQPESNGLRNRVELTGVLHAVNVRI